MTRNEPLVAELALVLAHRARALGVAVLAEAVGRVDLGAAEGVRALVARAPEEQQPRCVSNEPTVYLRGEPALGEAELVVGAARDGVVALARIERPLEHAERCDQLGDDEVRVGVAVAVEVAALVDRHAVDGELDVLPLARVEAAEEDLLGVALAALVGEQDPGREREDLARVLARHGGERRRRGW